MKKTVTALLLSLVMIVMSFTCFAASATDVNTADALNELGLFLGTGNGYELEKGLTRAEGVTLLVRMIGKEETAQNSVYENDFTDVPEWAAGYIGYAFENGITDGTGATTFSPDDEMTDYMFLTLVLRALDYFDKGEEPLFVWDDPYELAHGLKLIKSEEPDTKFTRADAIEIFWNALDVKLHNSDMTLAERLIEQRVFTARELAEAREIKEYGREENVGVPVIPTPDTDAPETDAPETDAPETDAPETDAPETDAPETDAPETDAPETDAPETDAPETDAPETDAPETDAPETDAPETDAPETDAPETDAPETDAPETDAPETDAPETDAPETDVPETDAPETDAPETDAPETDAPEMDAPETDAPKTDAPETDAPETDAPETDTSDDGDTPIDNAGEWN